MKIMIILKFAGEGSMEVNTSEKTIQCYEKKWSSLYTVLCFKFKKENEKILSNSLFMSIYE